MNPIRIFVSSVQKEFAEERTALRNYLRGDALMRRFFEVFLFEDVPAADRRADELYLDEVERCDLYVGLFGNDYGFQDAEGISPTEREFELASIAGKYRLVYVKGTDDDARHPRVRALVAQGAGGSRAQAIPLRGRTRDRALRSAGGVPGREAARPLRSVRRGSVSEGDPRRPRSRAHSVVRTHGAGGAPLPAERGHFALAGYIERMGTGTRDMIRCCGEAGLAEPEFAVTDGFVIRLRRVAKPVTPEVTRLVVALEGEMSRAELMVALELRDEKHFRERYLQRPLGPPVSTSSRRSSVPRTSISSGT